ncbi:dimethylaniline monooxygenase (N-oxide forming) [Apodospora peruviana]|uniref:Dimethylaniline monooxygenase (N-oxide forming) n=1 Tax=Apodospora peruviana TaxID=516989 RepID=A0AAE0HVA5_9PEZI|nr:dimethylaniline monooxygenase (N-oxide forming) [Apodospora peruviana]
MGEAIYTTTSSSQRIEAGSTNIQACPWPATAKDQSVDAAATADKIIESFNRALESKDYESLTHLFVEDGYWRDHLALSWSLRTLQGRHKIRDFLAKGCSLTKVDVDASSDFRKPQLTGFAPAGNVKGISLYTRIATQHGSGRGVIRLVETDNQWKIWIFFSTLEELKSHEEPLGPRRPNGVQHGATPGRTNWLDRRREEENFSDQEPVVLIIGAGQGGLTAAARLKMLNVPSLVIDRNDSIGDNWRKRYHQLVLHDPVWYDHMPYLEFPEWWPIYTPKDKLADWFDAYAKLLELNVWTRSEITSSSWDDAAKQWTVTIQRTTTTTKDGQQETTTETRTLHPKHIIQATGHSGKKHLPALPGMDAFQGDLLCHSSDFPGAQQQQPDRKKRAVVVGACNSSHDICQDYYEHGYDVTMVQRSSTCVVSAAAVLSPIYAETGPPVQDADVWFWGWPSAVFKAIQADVCQLQAQHDVDIHSGLAKAGFGLDNGVDGGGLFIKYFQRGGGYYIDVGTSQLIIDGKIKVKHGQEVTVVTERGLKFADGTELEADEVVFATGYENMRTQARAILGDELADRVGDIWGWDDEGEFRGIWRDSGHPGFWFHGGNLALCRYYSRILALQIKAKLEGLSQ